VITPEIELMMSNNSAWRNFVPDKFQVPKSL